MWTFVELVESIYSINESEFFLSIDEDNLIKKYTSSENLSHPNTIIKEAMEELYYLQSFNSKDKKI